MPPFILSPYGAGVSGSALLGGAAHQPSNVTAAARELTSLFGRAREAIFGPSAPAELAPFTPTLDPRIDAFAGSVPSLDAGAIATQRALDSAQTVGDQIIGTLGQPVQHSPATLFQQAADVVTCFAGKAYHSIASGVGMATTAVSNASDTIIGALTPIVTNLDPNVAMLGTAVLGAGAIYAGYRSVRSAFSGSGGHSPEDPNRGSSRFVRRASSAFTRIGVGGALVTAGGALLQSIALPWTVMYAGAAAAAAYAGYRLCKGLNQQENRQPEPTVLARGAHPAPAGLVPA